MSEDVTRRCDFKILEKRKYRECGLRVPGDKPVYVAAGADVFQMDLCETHQLKLEEAIAPFLDIAVEASTPVGLAIRKVLLTMGGAPTQSDIRVWAIENGYEVAATGALKKEVINAFNEAQA